MIITILICLTAFGGISILFYKCLKDKESIKKFYETIRNIEFMDIDEQIRSIIGTGNSIKDSKASLKEPSARNIEKATDKINQALFLIEVFFKDNLAARKFTMKYLEQALKELEDESDDR